MKKDTSTNNVISFLKCSGNIICGLAAEMYLNSLNSAEEQAFIDGIEIGIDKCIAALYEAKVDDKEIIRIVTEQWGISKSDAEDRLIWEKQQATIRSLIQHLKLQGYSKFDIDNYFQKNNVFGKIRHNNELWKLKDNPTKLIKTLNTK